MDDESIRNPDKPKGQLSNPLVSIITVVYNGYPEIEKTIRSVIDHSVNETEYIIIDGGSNDGTVDVIRKYESHIRFWVSEPDQGIYDALNKGIRASTGCYVYTLNTGDRLLDLPVIELTKAKMQEADVVLFWVQLSNGVVFKSTTDFRTRIGNTIHHQGAFYKNAPELSYNTRYRVYADFDLNQRLYLGQRKFLAFSKVISFHTLDGISNNRKYFREYLTVIKKNSGLLYMIIGSLYFKISDIRMYITTRFGKSQQQKDHRAAAS